MIIQEQIKQVWAVEQEILDVIDKVCSEHHLRYTLAYGTLIGAVRHGGFIPWDDDIDLIMPREDYDKLLSVWNDAAPEDYILQHIHITPDYTHTFTKSERIIPHFSRTRPRSECGITKACLWISSRQIVSPAGGCPGSRNISPAL